MNELAQGTASIVDGMEHGAYSVVVYVCALGIREVIPFSLEKKYRVYLTCMSVWR